MSEPTLTETTLTEDTATETTLTEDTAVDWAASAALLYVLGVLREVEQETARFRAALAEIRRKYRAELDSDSPAQFRLLRAMVERDRAKGAPRG